ncbi:MAG: hypothetical protein LBJ10_07060, partial [Clostridiales bacterium]|nr:hypothetical protein [Clostridiales bacterium]
MYINSNSGGAGNSADAVSALKVGMISLGCPKNLVDGEAMLGMLAERGCAITPDEKAADVIIINTCGFIDAAKKESIGAILDVAGRKRDGHPRVIVTGCLAERYGGEFAKELPEVDAVLGTREYAKICDAVAAIAGRPMAAQATADLPAGREQAAPPPVSAAEAVAGRGQGAVQAQCAEQAWHGGQGQGAEQAEPAEQAQHGGQGQDAEQAWCAEQTEPAEQAQHGWQERSAEQAVPAERARHGGQGRGAKQAWCAEQPEPAEQAVPAEQARHGWQERGAEQAGCGVQARHDGQGRGAEQAGCAEQAEPAEQPGSAEQPEPADQAQHGWPPSGSRAPAQARPAPRPILACDDRLAHLAERRIVTTGHMGYAYLKIAEGCDNRCTFCVIPSLRGEYRSRSVGEIV